MLSALFAVLLVTGPVLVRSPEATPTPPEGTAAWLWLNTLSPTRRAHVADRLEGLATRLEARFHPLIHDFEDEPLGDDVRRFLRHHLPGLNAARALSAGAWAAPGGGSMRLARVCPSGAECADVHTLPAHEAFRAWPVAHGIILKVRFIEASVLAAHLREWLAPDTRGLIVTAADLVPRPAPRVAAAAQRLYKRLKRLEPRYAQHLKGLLTATRPEPLHLPIAPDEVWVVPRLAGLAQLPALRATVRAATAGLFVEWRAERD